MTVSEFFSWVWGMIWNSVGGMLGYIADFPLEIARALWIPIAICVVLGALTLVLKNWRDIPVKPSAAAMITVSAILCLVVSLLALSPLGDTTGPEALRRVFSVTLQVSFVVSLVGLGLSLSRPGK